MPWALPKLKYLAVTVSVLALLAAPGGPLAADINITSGSVAYDPATMSGRTISINGSSARFIIDASHAIANGIDVSNGGTLENHGTLVRTGSGEQGFSGAHGHLENYGAISSAIRQGVVLFNGGTVLNSGPVASISGADAYGVSIQGASGSLRNENGGRITGPTAGVYISQGGDVTNTGAGSMISGGVAVYGDGGTITNADGAEIAGRVVLNGGGTVNNTGTGTVITSTNPNDAAVALETTATLNNSDGASISGARQGVYLAEGGTVSNGAGSSITGGTKGVESVGTLTLTNHGTITGDSNGILVKDTASITNHGIVTATSDTAIELYGGEVTSSGAGALIDAAGIGIFMDGEGEVTNTDGARIVAGGDGIIMNYGGNVTNASGATIDSDVAGVVIWDYGTVTNRGAGSAIRSTGNVAVDFSPYDYNGPFILENLDGALVDAGYAGVRFFGSGSVRNSGAGSTISANSYAVFFEEEAGEVVNENGAHILSRHGSGVVLYHGGEVVNRSGGMIEGPVTGIFVLDGGLNLLNTGAGTVIKGAVYNPDGDGTITNSDGARIEGGIRLGSGSVTNSSATIIADGDAVRINGNGVVTNTGTINAGLHAIYLANGGTVTTTNGSISGGNTIQLDGDGTVTANGGTISASGTAIRINGDGTASATGTTITASSNGINLNGNGTVALSNGSIIAGGDGINLAGNGTVTLGNGGITAGGYAIRVGNGSSVSASNTTMTASGDGIRLTQHGSVNLNGGRLTAGGNAIHMGTGGTIDIDGTVVTGGSIAIGGDGLMTIANSGAIAADDYAIYSPTDIALTNTSGGHIEGGIIGVYIVDGGGTITNEAGATISGQSAIHAFGDTTLVNKGRLEGKVLLARTDRNTVTLHSGSVITGDLEIGDHSSSTLTLTGTGHQLYSDAVLGETSFASKLIKTGSGTWIVDKAIDATIINIDAGTLIVGIQGNGQIVGTVNVNPGSVISGSGKVYGNLIVDRATVAPGNSPGVLTIVGGYAPGAGSILEIELDPRNISSDRVDVIGNAVIDPAAELKIVRIDNNPYTIGTRYTVLTTTTGRGGTFTLTGDLNPSGFLAIEDEYDADNVYLVVRQTRSLAAAANTPNQRAVAGGLDKASGSLNLRNVALNAANDSEARAIFDAVSGEVHVALGRDILSSLSGTASMLVEQLRGENTLWARSNAGSGFARTDGNGQDTRTAVGSLLFGGDSWLNNQLRLGVAAGIVSTTTSLGSATASATLPVIGLYGAAGMEPLALRFGALAGPGNLHAQSDLGLPGLVQSKAAYGGLGGFAFAELAYSSEIASARVEPFMGVSLAGLGTGAFAESSTGLNGQTFAHDLASTLGFRASSSLDMGGFALDLSGEVSWRHTLAATGNGQFNFDGGQPFSIAATGKASDALNLGLGASIQLKPSASIGVSYRATWSGTSSSQSAQLSLRASF